MVTPGQEHALRSIEEELRHERAAALGRTGQKLEALIQEAEAALEQARACALAERADAWQRFRESRDRARYQLWCFIVQREAVGLRDHTEVESFYRVPDPEIPA